MSRRQYNFSSVKHSDNNMLAPITPRFEAPSPSLDTYMHRPQQVGGPSGWFLIPTNGWPGHQAWRDVPSKEDSGRQLHLSIFGDDQHQREELYSQQVGG